MEQSYPMAVIATPGKIEFQEKKLPQMHDHSVLLRVKAASICGGDLHIFKGKHPMSPLPVAIGHELSGEVLKTGKKVTKVKEGDRVVVEPVVVCGKCFFCRTGEYNRCKDINVQYRKGQGAFAPYFVAEENWTHKLPQGISFEEGALIEPLSVGVHAVKAAGIRMGHSIAVFGAGALGLMVLHLAKLSGAAETFVVDINDFRLEKAKKLGAVHTINASQHEAVKFILAQTDQLGVDRAFEAVGLEKTLVDAMKVLKKGRTAVILGLFEDQEVRIPANILVSREIALKGSLTYCWDFQDTIKLLEMGEVNLGEIITHTLPISKLQQAFELLMDPANEAVKVVVQMG